MKTIAKAILTLGLLCSAVCALGAVDGSFTSLLIFAGLLAVCALCAKGLKALGTFSTKTL